MPTLSFSDPQSGKAFDVPVPDGVTQDQYPALIQSVLSDYHGSQSAPSLAPSPAPSVPSGIPRQPDIPGSPYAKLDPGTQRIADFGMAMQNEAMNNPVQQALQASIGSAANALPPGTSYKTLAGPGGDVLAKFSPQGIGYSGGGGPDPLAQVGSPGYNAVKVGGGLVHRQTQDGVTRITTVGPLPKNLFPTAQGTNVLYLDATGNPTTTVPAAGHTAPQQVAPTWPGMLTPAGQQQAASPIGGMVNVLGNEAYNDVRQLPSTIPAAGKLVAEGFGKLAQAQGGSIDPYPSAKGSPFPTDTPMDRAQWNTLGNKFDADALNVIPLGAGPTIGKAVAAAQKGDMAGAMRMVAAIPPEAREYLANHPVLGGLDIAAMLGIGHMAVHGMMPAEPLAQMGDIDMAPSQAEPGKATTLTQPAEPAEPPSNPYAQNGKMRVKIQTMQAPPSDATPAPAPTMISGEWKPNPANPAEQVGPSGAKVLKVVKDIDGNEEYSANNVNGHQGTFPTEAEAKAAASTGAAVTTTHAPTIPAEPPPVVPAKPTFSVGDKATYTGNDAHLRNFTSGLPVTIDKIYPSVGGAPVDYGVTASDGSTSFILERDLARHADNSTAPTESPAVETPQTVGAGNAQTPTPTTPKKPGPTMVGNLNLPRMGMDDPASKDLMTGVVNDLGIAKRLVKSRDQTAADSNALGLTVDDLKHLTPGQVPGDTTGDAYGTALRNLNAYQKRNYDAIAQAEKDNPTPDGPAKLADAMQDLRTATLHNSEMASQTGRGLGARNIVVDGSRTGDVQSELRNVPSLADAQETPPPAATFTKKPAEATGTKPGRTYGGNNKGVTLDDMEAIRARNAAKKAAQADQYGSGISGLVKSIIHGEEGEYDPEAAADLVKMARFHIEAATKALGGWTKDTYTEWAKNMRGELGPHVSDGDLQALYAHTRTAMVKDAQGKQKNVANMVFTDQLANRFGSRKAVSKFIDAISGPEGDNDILDKIISGREGELTQSQKDMLSSAYADSKKKFGKSKPSNGALAAVDEIVRAHQAAKKSGPVQGPPTAEKAWADHLAHPFRLGKGGAAQFRAQLGPDAFHRVAAGEGTESDLNSASAAYEAIRKAKTPGPGQPKMNVAPGFNDALGQFRKDQAAAKNAAAKAAKGPSAARTPLPPPSEQALFGRRVKGVLKGNTDAFFGELRGNHRDIANALDNGRDLTPEQNNRLGNLYLKHQPAKVPPAEQPRLIKALNAAVKESNAQFPRNKPYGPPTAAETTDRIVSRYTGKEGAAKVGTALGATPEGAEILRKLDAREGLKDQEKITLAKAIDAERPAPKTQKVTGDALAKEMAGIVRDAKAGKLNYDNPIDMVRDHILRTAAGDKFDAAKFSDDLQKVETLPDGTVTDKGRKQLAELVNQYAKRGYGDNLGAYIKANLLSNPATLVRIGLSHVMSTVTEDVLNRPAAAAVDRAIAARTGQRSVQSFSGRDTIGAAGKSLSRGMLRDVGTIMQGGDTALALRNGRPEIAPDRRLSPEFTTRSKAANAVMRVPMRIHQSLYHMIGSAVYDRALREAAWTEAAKTGEDAAKLYGNPTKAMVDRARTEYEHQMFTNENELSSKLHSKNQLVQAGVDVALPFTRVPSNIVGRQMEYTPLGAAVSAYKQLLDVRNGGKPMTMTQQANLARTASRGLTGTALTALGYEAARHGVITPENDAKHQLPALNIGSHHYDLSRTGPVTAPIMIGAGLAAKGGPDWQSMGKNFLADQPLMQGAQNAQSYFDPNPHSVESTTAGVISEGIPMSSALRGAAAIQDPYMRAKNSVGDYLKAGLPGASETLPKMYDQQGQPIMNPRHQIGLLPGANVADPNTPMFGTTQGKIQAVQDALTQAQQDMKSPISSPDDQVKRQVIAKFSKEAGIYMSQLSRYRQGLQGGRTAPAPTLDPKLLDAFTYALGAAHTMNYKGVTEAQAMQQIGQKLTQIAHGR